MKKKQLLWAMTKEAKDTYDPEMRLWVGAFEETIRTALGQVRAEKARPQVNKRIQEEARREIFTDGGDFEEICCVLNVNIEYVRRQIKELEEWKSAMRKKFRLVH